MTGTLEYDLSDPDDKRAHLCAVKSLEMAMAIWNLQHNFWKIMEYRIESAEVDKYGAMELIRAEINQIFEDINSDEYIN